MGTLREKLPWPLLGYTVLALVLCRDALWHGGLVGRASGEGWGRLFMTRQVGRWLTGAAPAGHADLLNWPDGQPIWPIDPALQLLQVPAELLAPGAGLIAATLAVLITSGAATARLARTLGASAGPAFLSGLLVMLAPALLHNLNDAVIEAAAAGFIALAVDQIVAAHRDPRPRTLALAGGAIGLLAAVSPYFAIYTAIGCALAVPWTLRRWRVWLQVAAVGAVGCALALAPLLATESGDHGRLKTAASPQMMMPGKDKPRPRATAGTPGRPQPSLRLERRLRLVPGGVLIVVASLAALAAPGGRRWAALGAVFFLGGPGLTMMGRPLGVEIPHRAPLQALLDAVSEGRLGNTDRLLTPWIVLSAAAIALTLSRPRLRPRQRAVVVAILAAAVLAEGMLHDSRLRLPTTPLRPPRAVLAALEGPTVVFPSGEFPAFHPSVAPKEVLVYAALAGVPIGADYGRQRAPTDLRWQRLLSEQAGTPLPLFVAELVPSTEDARFCSLLLLDSRLPAPARARLAAWLVQAGAEERAAADGMSAWRLPEPRCVSP